MSGKIATLPIWKKDSTAAEWLHEVAAMALEKPQRFGRVIIAFEETRPNGATVMRYHCHGIETNTEVLGLLVIAQQEVLTLMGKGE